MIRANASVSLTIILSLPLALAAGCGGNKTPSETPQDAALRIAALERDDSGAYFDSLTPTMQAAVAARARMFGGSASASSDRDAYLTAAKAFKPAKQSMPVYEFGSAKVNGDSARIVLRNTKTGKTITYRLRAISGAWRLDAID